MCMVTNSAVFKMVLFCGCHNFMIPDVTRVIFLALVPVLQGAVRQPSHLLVYIHSK